MNSDSLKAVRTWLLLVICCILSVVIVGGITRMTGSGLSITEWKPIMGAIPPLNESDWNEAFLKYQQIPQFQLVNSQMDLAGFKWLFFWEYLHRLLARTVGLVFLFPFIYFIARKQISIKWAPYLAVAFILGGAQGFLGWFMVKSGLSQLTSVSHFRLAAHLLLALTIAAYLGWIYDKMAGTPATPFKLRSHWCVLVILTWIQTLWGAFTAGLKAGFQFQTFPTFHGYWIHPQLFDQTPLLFNFVNNPITVQWVHRILGTLIVTWVCVTYVKARGDLNIRRLLLPSLVLVTAQYGIGIALVMNGMPYLLGAFHQGIGSLFLLSVIRVYLRTGPSLSPALKASFSPSLKPQT